EQTKNTNDASHAEGDSLGEDAIKKERKSFCWGSKGTCPDTWSNLSVDERDGLSHARNAPAAAPSVAAARCRSCASDCQLFARDFYPAERPHIFSAGARNAAGGLSLLAAGRSWRRDVPA